MKLFELVLRLAGLMLVSTLTPAFAHSRYDYRDRYYRPKEEHPYVNKALLGGGTGAVLGSLLARDGYRTDGAIKGALLGAGIGVGYEYLKRQGTFSRGW